MSQEFFDVLHTRRSVRHFEDRPVPDELVERVIDGVRYCPSSMGAQPWQVHVVTDPETKARLNGFKTRWCPPGKSRYLVDWLDRAPTVLVVCVDEADSHGRAVENGVIAATYLMLAATAVGLGSTFLTAHDPEDPRQAAEARQILDLPESVAPISIVPLGFPAEEPPHRRLRTLDEVMHRERLTR